MRFERSVSQEKKTKISEHPSKDALKRKEGVTRNAKSRIAEKFTCSTRAKFWKTRTFRKKGTRCNARANKSVVKRKDASHRMRFERSNSQEKKTKISGTYLERVKFWNESRVPPLKNYEEEDIYSRVMYFFCFACRRCRRWFFFHPSKSAHKIRGKVITTTKTALF